MLILIHAVFGYFCQKCLPPVDPGCKTLNYRMVRATLQLQCSAIQTNRKLQQVKPDRH